MTITARIARHGPANSWDIAKTLALSLMVIDHVGAFLFTPYTDFRVIGRAAAPLFLFLTGYARHYRFSYLLPVFGMLITFSDIAARGVYLLNILFLIAFTRRLLQCVEEDKLSLQKPWDWFIICILLLPSMRLVEYGSLLIPFAVAGHLLSRGRMQEGRSMLIGACILYFICEWMIFRFSLPQAAVLAAVIAATGFYMARFRVHDVALPAPAAHAVTWLGRTTLYTYAAHLIALQWIYRSMH